MIDDPYEGEEGTEHDLRWSMRSRDWMHMEDVKLECEYKTNTSAEYVLPSVLEDIKFANTEL